ncbi:hypothetical protein DAPPUDRAFT_240737 [Daphnia pulex]|uniref:Uncharacterized protein n=1 Tax=Daphnia pulex TaxID=6669 RepID=E9GCD8_DAPPU|nr:hypothetical protein DAPPUDRAFT_240737 [Daphnia pulex]|eukprot:EFX82530.1 hypothetical protein DAPPUDRAFT_240737 [Daphnia pulex]
MVTKLMIVRCISVAKSRYDSGRHHIQDKEYNLPRMSDVTLSEQRYGHVDALLTIPVSHTSVKTRTHEINRGSSTSPHGPGQPGQPGQQMLQQKQSKAK